MSPDHQVRRVVHKGEQYWVVCSPTGRWLGPAEIENLAAIPSRHHSEWRITLVIADEGTPREPENPPLRVAGLHAAPGLPLHFLDTGLVVGHAEQVWLAEPGEIPETTGACLLAIVRLAETALADLVWIAVQEGVWTGICPAILRERWDAARTVIVSGEVAYLTLGDRQDNCLSGCRVLHYEEVAAAGPPPDLIER